MKNQFTLEGVLETMRIVNKTIYGVDPYEDDVCGYCGGTGELACDESDGEGHIQRGVGIEKCICQINK